MALTKVVSDGIATGAVTSDQIAAGAVTTADLEDSGVTAGTYGSSSAIPAITVDAKGRITSASTNAISVESDRIFEGNTSAEAVDTGSDGHFKVVTEGTEALRIDSSQRVGLGTSGPDANSQLHIVGSSYQPLYVNTTSANGGGAAFFQSGTQALYTGTAGSTWLSGSAATDGLVRAEANLILATNGNTERARITSTGDFRFNSGYGSVATAYGCRAWANGDCSTDTLRGSGNVSSITEIGGGEHRFNYTSAITDANYSIVATSGGISGATGDDSNASLTSSEVITTSCRVRTNASNPYMINIAVFR